MGKNTILSANEARKIADTTVLMRNHLYKQIKKEANDGKVKTTWSIYGCSENNVNLLIKDLKDNGYIVDKVDHPAILMISW